MENGLSSEARVKRQKMFEFNYRSMIDELDNCTNLIDPVGFIIEMTDPQGKEIAYEILEGQGMEIHEIPEVIAGLCRDNSAPTLKILFPMEFAKILLASFTTGESSAMLRQIPGYHWFVIIGSGGNSYECVPRTPVQ